MSNSHIPTKDEEKYSEDEPTCQTLDADNKEDEFIKIIKAAVQETVPEVLKVMGQFSDADPDEISEPLDQYPEIVPEDKLDDVFSNASVSDFEDDKPEVAPPSAEGLDFTALEKTVRVLKGKSNSTEDLRVAQSTLPELAGTEIIERISLDPIIRKRILMIECKLPDMLFAPEMEESAPPKKSIKKIVFHTDIDTTGIDAIDFNIIR